MAEKREYQPGDIVQILPSHGREGWIGALLIVTEIKEPWGVMGFVHVVENHDKAGFAYIRLPWDQIEWVGRAVLMPEAHALAVIPAEEKQLAKEDEST